MRRALKTGVARLRQARIIPAYAGSTRGSCPLSRPSWDHPRVCGEHASQLSKGSRVVGSSPRMRGAPGGVQERDHPQGIIPAYAGSTARCRRRRRGSWDHPRACGEHRDADNVGFARKGSSPRMRGAHLRRRVLAQRVGIIPAYAGSTSSSSAAPTPSRDHPRVCGEHQRMNVRHELRRGSSPRMRRARYVQGEFIVFRGIIPAYAGSTRRLRVRLGGARDHPRVCGEHQAT